MIKRVFDLTLSAVGLTVLSPLFACIALLVKAGDGGKVFFTQDRVGFQRKVFRIVKFRTMVRDAEQMGAGITKGGDPRITAIGRWLRKTKLDELPQLWNVLVGDMSFVGPRPEIPKYVEKYTPQQAQVLLLKPGITDLATISYRNEEEILRAAHDLESFYAQQIMPQKIELNLLYARHANLWEDLKIILRTVIPQLRLQSKAERIVQSHNPAPGKGIAVPCA